MKLTNTNSNHQRRWVVAIAYILVVLIWSTTPITVKWSGEGVSYLFGIVVRMAIGAIVALILVMIKFNKLPLDKSSCKAYTAAAVALFGGMMPVYWGAQYVTSGLISVIFGISPIVTGYLAWRFIQEQSINGMKILGAIAGIAGLVIIFVEDTPADDNYLYGVIAITVAVIMHAASAVWVKSMKVSIPALSIVAGGLLFSMPLFIAVYLIFAPSVPEVIPAKALWSIVYLGVVGSVIGFVCYYFLLKNLPASSVALVTLITPVTALWIGNVMNNENITNNIYIGTCFVLMGLALHQWGSVWSVKVCKLKSIFYG